MDSVWGNETVVKEELHVPKYMPPPREYDYSRQIVRFGPSAMGSDMYRTGGLESLGETVGETPVSEEWGMLTTEDEPRPKLPLPVMANISTQFRYWKTALYTRPIPDFLDRFLYNWRHYIYWDPLLKSMTARTHSEKSSIHLLSLAEAVMANRHNLPELKRYLQSIDVGVEARKKGDFIKVDDMKTRRGVRSLIEDEEEKTALMVGAAGGGGGGATW